MSDPLRIIQKMNSTPSFLRIRRSTRHHRSLETFKRNSALLMQTMVNRKWLSGTTVSPDGSKHSVAEMEIIRILFNYINSALAMLDHLRAVDIDVFGNCDVSKRPDYPSIIGRFRRTTEYQLVDGLRQFMHHYDLPSLTVTDEDVALQSHSLLQWSRWKQEKKYAAAYELLQKHQAISIPSLLLNYSRVLAMLFADYDTQSKIHLSEDVAIYNSLMDEYNSCYKQIFQEIVSSALNSPNSPKDTLEMNLLGTVSHEFWRPIEESKNVRERGEAMIVALRSEGVEFDEERIRSLYVEEA